MDTVWCALFCWVMIQFITISLTYLHGSLRVAPMARDNHNASGVTLKGTAISVQYPTATNTIMCVPLWVVSISVNQSNGCGNLTAGPVCTNALPYFRSDCSDQFNWILKRYIWSKVESKRRYFCIDCQSQQTRTNQSSNQYISTQIIHHSIYKITSS